MIKGRYLAELTREVFQDLEASKYQKPEYRISIYGKNTREWNLLSSWVIDNSLLSNNVRWLIQIPRLYSVYKDAKVIDNFAQLLSSFYY